MKIKRKRERERERLGAVEKNINVSESNSIEIIRFLRGFASLFFLFLFFLIAIVIFDFKNRYSKILIICRAKTFDIIKLTGLLNYYYFIMKQGK